MIGRTVERIRLDLNRDLTFLHFDLKVSPYTAEWCVP